MGRTDKVNGDGDEWRRGAQESPERRDHSLQTRSLSRRFAQVSASAGEPGRENGEDKGRSVSRGRRTNQERRAGFSGTTAKIECEQVRPGA